MRQPWRLLALGAVLALAGCTASLPAGVDGDLTNGWPAMPEPTVSVPVAGACYNQELTGGVAAGDQETQDCQVSHQVETVYVGSFTGDDAQRSSPPTGGPARAVAYAGCRKGAVDYLGDDYHMGMLKLDLVVPTPAAWTGGARWYRCDIARFTSALGNQVESGAGSVKDSLRGARPLALMCYTHTRNSDGTDEEYVSACDKPHNSELAGLYTAPDIPWPADETTRENLGFKGCDGVVGAYLGFTGGHDDSPYLGYAISPFDQAQWELGDRTIRCSVIGLKNNSPNNVQFTGSVKGLRDKKPQGWI
jgi:hypothetical protein